jgi:hypothetical protein
MKRVTGIGGVFFSAKDPAKMQSWYKTHLGIDVQSWGGASFPWVDDAGAPVNGTTAWLNRRWLLVQARQSPRSWSTIA